MHCESLLYVKVALRYITIASMRRSEINFFQAHFVTNSRLSRPLLVMIALVTPSSSPCHAFFSCNSAQLSFFSLFVFLINMFQYDPFEDDHDHTLGFMPWHSQLQQQQQQQSPFHDGKSLGK